MSDEVKLLREMADTQEHYASEAYAHFSESDRNAFRHGAYILRLAADRIERAKVKA